MSEQKRSCHGEGCPRADLCRRHMDAVDEPTYFAASPVQADGTCTEFVGNGWTRGPEIRCGGAHPPPRCACQCEIELHRWEQRDGKWKWIAGAVH
jgi:hypothetical protein